MDLNMLWFFLLGILLIGYAVLDGFDLGVGTLHLLTKTDNDRRIMLNSIGPVWDGNEVWLVTFGGGLFAAFPHVYATVFSGFYLAFMLLLFALIFRAIAIEFRSKQPSRVWRRTWDFFFFLSSSLISVLFGVAVGNMMRGIQIGADMEYAGTFLDLVSHPYPWLVGLLTLAMFTMHGAIYLNLKTEGDLQERAKQWVWPAWGIFLALYMLVTIITLITIPTATKNFTTYPAVWALVFLNVLAIANIPRAVYKNLPGQAFISSVVCIGCLIGLLGAALFPNMVVSSLDPAYSLNIYNAASSEKTLGIMRTVAFIGLPFVLSYTVAIYWIFRGKTELGAHSY